MDKKVQREAEVRERKGKIIVEGRTQAISPKSIKIFIKVSPGRRARRIWKDQQDKEKQERRNEGKNGII